MTCAVSRRLKNDVLNLPIAGSSWVHVVTPLQQPPPTALRYVSIRTAATRKSHSVVTRRLPSSFSKHSTAGHRQAQQQRRSVPIRRLTRRATASWLLKTASRRSATRTEHVLYIRRRRTLSTAARQAAAHTPMSSLTACLVSN